MGRSLTNNHILNADRLTKAQFKKAFTDMMKSKGYTKATEDDAAVSYSLVFTKDRKWVTVTGEDLNAAELAKSLSMQVLSVELVDSDFAEIKLHSKDGAEDTLMLGEPYFDEYPEPNPEAWSTVLGENDWSKVEEIQSADCTFAEDALAEFAQLIGLGNNVLADAEDMLENAEMLHFKNAKEKKLTFNTAFVKVYGEYFESLGFKKMKGNNTYVKLIDNEVVLTLSCYKFKDIEVRPPIDPSYIQTHDMNKFMAAPNPIIDKDIQQFLQQFHLKFSFDEKLLQQFEVRFRVATVYDDNPFCGGDSFVDIYKYTNKNNIDLNYRLKIWNFSYLKESEESLLASMMYTFDLSKTYFVPYFDKINSFEDAINYNCDFGFKRLYKDWFLIAGDYRSILEKRFQREVEIEKINFEKGLVKIQEPGESFYDVKKRMRVALDNFIEYLDDIKNNPIQYSELMNRIEKNKKRNIELLAGL